MQYLRKGGRIKEKTSTRGDPEYHRRSLLEGEGIRLQNKCSTSVLKNYIGIIEDHTHFLLDAIYIFGRGVVNLILRIGGWGIVTKVCNEACSLS